MTKDDGRRERLRLKYADMHRSLEFEEFDSLDTFLLNHRIDNNDYYLDILRAGITRPKIFVRRSITQRWINNFNPWVTNICDQIVIYSLFWRSTRVPRMSLST